MSAPEPLAAIADAGLEATVVGSFSRIGFVARRWLHDWHGLPAGALSGRTALVTGASSGLGRETAAGLARLGARVVLLGRDRVRTEQARDQLAHETGNDDLHVVRADLSRLGEVEAAAEAVSRDHERLDVVVHNAGTLVHELVRTDDGLELTAQVHVVAPFALTAGLLPLLAATPDALVVTVTSGGMYTTRLDVDALDHPPVEGFDGVRAYAMAKRAQVVLTEEWARRAGRTGVEFEAMHPGWADSAGIRRALPRFSRLLGPLLRSPSEGVDTTLWLAAAHQRGRTNGLLWLDRHPRRTVYLPRTSTPPEEAERLWDWCVGRSGADDPAAAAARDLTA